MEQISSISVPSSLSWLDVTELESGDYEIIGVHEDTSHVSRMLLSRDLTRVDVEQSVKLTGSGPAHVLVDGGMVYVANYGDGTWSTLDAEDMSELSHQVFPLDPASNCTSHPHQTVARGGWVWVVDLGCDVVYTLATQGTPAQTRIPGGCGPRHMALHPSQDIAAIICELKSLVLTYRYLHHTSYQ